MPTRIITAIACGFTLFIGWFAWSMYTTARPIAEESLRGAALSIAAAVEHLAASDRSFAMLDGYASPDLAYLSVSDHNGVILFHTNSRLINQRLRTSLNRPKGANGFEERRVRLGTGEEAYLARMPLHADGKEYLLTLALHTYRYDRVIRRAKTGVIVLASMVCAGWLLVMIISRYMRREEMHRLEMHHRQEMVRLGEMGALLAHEIRNPLGGIKGFAQLVEESDDAKRSAGFASKIVTQASRLEDLVNDLLAFAREEKDAHVPLDLAPLVEESVALVRHEAEQQHIDVKLSIARGIVVPMAAERIEQLLLNLCKNAVQAMPGGGELRAELRRERDMAIITIADSGIGIQPTHLDHIFEPFWTSKARGTGLGLALCRRIAEEHGGAVRVKSAVNQGTVFTVELPLTT